MNFRELRLGEYNETVEFDRVVGDMFFDGSLMAIYYIEGSNEFLDGLMPLTYYGSLLILASAFLLGGIALFTKTLYKKYAIFAMVISVLSAIAFFVGITVNLMLDFPT